MTTSCLIDASAATTQVGEVRRSQLNGIPPDCIDDFLAWRTLDETFGFANDSQLDCVANGFFKVIISFLSCVFEDAWVASDVDRPICSDRQGKVEQAIRI